MFECTLEILGRSRFLAILFKESLDCLGHYGLIAAGLLKLQGVAASPAHHHRNGPPSKPGDLLAVAMLQCLRARVLRPEQFPCWDLGGVYMLVHSEHDHPRPNQSGSLCWNQSMSIRGCAFWTFIKAPWYHYISDGPTATTKTLSSRNPEP